MPSGSAEGAPEGLEFLSADRAVERVSPLAFGRHMEGSLGQPVAVGPAGKRQPDTAIGADVHGAAARIVGIALVIAERRQIAAASRVGKTSFSQRPGGPKSGR